MKGDMTWQLQNWVTASDEKTLYISEKMAFYLAYISGTHLLIICSVRPVYNYDNFMFTNQFQWCFILFLL